jgi:hypothetical protein
VGGTTQRGRLEETKRSKKELKSISDHNVPNGHAAGAREAGTSMLIEDVACPVGSLAQPGVPTWHGRKG